MSCPSEIDVARFVSGAVGDDERAGLTAHLADCAPCCALVGALLEHRSRSSQESTRSADDTPARAATAAPSPLPAMDAESRGLGRYRIGEPIGAGGSGIVYAAYDSRLERPVALKMLWAQSRLGCEGTRLQGEARAMAKLAHPNVLPVFDIGVEDGRLFVAMELVEGGTLRAWLAAGPHPWREVLARFRQAGNGLAAAHHVGLVHRDFKPDNVLVRADGTVLVTDFGLAREVRPGDASLAASHRVAVVSDTGKVGTPVYMAPEQLRGEQVDVRADVYAFSVALWEALFGERPFALAPVPELLAHIARGPAEPRRRAQMEEVPATLVGALRKGMAFRRSDRPASIDALLAECEPTAAATKAPVAARATSIAVLVATLVTGGVVLGRELRPAPGQVAAPTTLRAAVAGPPVAELAESPLPLAPLAYPSATTVARPRARPAAPAPLATFEPPTGGASFAAVDTVEELPEPPAAPAASSSAARPRRLGALHGMDFAPFGPAGMQAIETTHAHESDFAPCLQSACNNVTCRLQVASSGVVSSVGCVSWKGEPACTETQACLEKKIAGVRYPAPARVGESMLFFSAR